MGQTTISVKYKNKELQSKYCACKLFIFCQSWNDQISMGLEPKMLNSPFSDDGGKYDFVFLWPRVFMGNVFAFKAVAALIYIYIYIYIYILLGPDSFKRSGCGCDWLRFLAVLRDLYD